MLDGFYLYLGYKMAVSITYQGTDSQISFLFINPYITKLVKEMGVLEGTYRIRVVGEVALCPLRP